MHLFTRSQFAIVLVGLMMVVLVAACGGTAVSQSTPTPTPTLTLPPLLAQPFLDLAPEATFGDVMERLPVEERACVEQALGADRYQQLLQQPAFEQDSFGLQETDLDPSCFTPQTLAGLLTAGVAQQAGGLGEGTMRCIEGTFVGFDLSQFQESGQAAPQDQAGIFGALTGMLLCLTPEEAKRIEIGPILGEGGPPLTLHDLRCVLQRVDVSVFTQLFGLMAEGQPGGQPGEFDQQQFLRLAQAFQACGIPLTPPGAS